jgi:hypothetical protein
MLLFVLGASTVYYVKYIINLGNIHALIKKHPQTICSECLSLKESVNLII